LSSSYFHASVLVAGSGIELLLHALYCKLRTNVRSGDPLPKEVEIEISELSKSKPIDKWTLGDWIKLYRTCNLIQELSKRFGYNLMRFDEKRLNHANEIWRKCKHESKQAEEKDASKVCNYLKSFLEECNYRSRADSPTPARERNVDEFGERWLDEWREEIARWLPDKSAHHGKLLIEALPNLLELALGLIGDHTIPARLRTQLMVAVDYVISTVDLMPEVGLEVRGLVDDSAVLVMTLDWLLRQKEFNVETLHAHWQGGYDIISKITVLETYIYENSDVLFKESRLPFKDNSIWSAIRGVAEIGPEALWQNYWKEAY